MKLKVTTKNNNSIASNVTIIIDCLYFELFNNPDEKNSCWITYMPSNTEDCYTEYTMANIVRIESL